MARVERLSWIETEDQSANVLRLAIHNCPARESQATKKAVARQSKSPSDGHDRGITLS